ncbi:MAG: tetratricopeptide repeat protein, partial [bacterium]
MIVWFLCGAAALGLMNFKANAEEAPPSSSTPVVLDAADLSSFQPSENELFAQATDSQKREDYSRALQLFTDLLRFYPQGTTAEETLHRMAECYRALGRFSEATETLKLNREKFPQGAWLDAGFLLEGEMLASDGKWKEALEPLERAANAKAEEVQQRALYLIVLARENLNELAQARPQLEKLAEAKKDYSDFARVKLGAIE